MKKTGPAIRKQRRQIVQNRGFRPWWFETGSPEFLFRALMDQEVSPIELEFKMAEGEGETEDVLDRAIAQMRDRGYGEKYRDRGEPLRLVALVFGRSGRNLLEIRAESA